jgi:hypothetical protein
MQASAEQVFGSASGPTNPQQHEHARNSNTGGREYMTSDGTPIGVVPLQPPSSSETMPNQGFTFDPSNMETMGAFVKETLRQMGVSEATVTKTRRKPTRSARSKGIKAQQASMSREADMAWKVMG